MTLYVALLRAINVGGKNPVAMPSLGELLDRLGFLNPRTVLQSGNLVFQAKAGTAKQIEEVLGMEAALQLGLKTDFMVRTAAEWRAVVAGNPFPEAAAQDPGHLVVLFLKNTPSAKDVEALQTAIQGPEVIRAYGKQLYVVYPNGIGRSKLTASFIERALGIHGTARNWNTVLKIKTLLNVE
jgi:uncharacterized protein (DUF1697 family)